MINQELRCIFLFICYYILMDSYNKIEFQLALIKASNIEFNKQFEERFSRILHNKQVMFETGPGWRPMLWELFERIETIAMPYKIQIEIQQIKEKFGNLRFYYEVSSVYEEDEVNRSALVLIGQLVDIYKEKSYHICDITGRYYKYRINSGSWVYACCYSAFIERYKTTPEMVEWARKDMVTQVQFDTIINNIKFTNKQRQFITSLSQTGILNDYLDDVSISKLIEHEFWLDPDKL